MKNPSFSISSRITSGSDSRGGRDVERPHAFGSKLMEQRKQTKIVSPLPMSVVVPPVELRWVVGGVSISRCGHTFTPFFPLLVSCRGFCFHVVHQITSQSITLARLYGRSCLRRMGELRRFGRRGRFPRSGHCVHSGDLRHVTLWNTSKTKRRIGSPNMTTTLYWPGPKD